jgi:hypothetical protein
MPVAPFVWAAAQFLGKLGRLLPLTRLKEVSFNFIMGPFEWADLQLAFSKISDARWIGGRQPRRQAAAGTTGLRLRRNKVRKVHNRSVPTSARASLSPPATKHRGNDGRGQAPAGIGR